MRENSDDQMMLFSRKQLAGLILPLFAEQLLAVFVGMIDVIMVSYAGEAAVSGVALVDSINNLIIQILFAVTAGGTVVCAYYIGKKDIESAGRSGAQMLLVTVSAMLVLSVFFILFRKVLLGVLFESVEQKVMDNAMTYMFSASAWASKEWQSLLLPLVSLWRLERTCCGCGMQCLLTGL